jgi:hypothetical protein
VVAHLGGDAGCLGPPAHHLLGIIRCSRSPFEVQSTLGHGNIGHRNVNGKSYRAKSVRAMLAQRIPETAAVENMAIARAAGRVAV